MSDGVLLWGKVYTYNPTSAELNLLYRVLSVEIYLPCRDKMSGYVMQSMRCNEG
jgi:hypothetical protein